MALPALVHYRTIQQYRAHFERVYCQGPIATFDGIPVYFRKTNFDHCMFESSKRDGTKDEFSTTRSRRIDWIRATLTNPKATLYQGWDSRKKRCDPSRRVAVVYEDFVVIIRVRMRKDGSRVADFLTAYQADVSIARIRAMPVWK